MCLEFISLQSHNPVDDAKEELKEDISNLRQEVMVGFVLQCIVIGRAFITLFYKYIPTHFISHSNSKSCSMFFRWYLCEPYHNGSRNLPQGQYDDVCESISGSRNLHSNLVYYGIILLADFVYRYLILLML